MKEQEAKDLEQLVGKVMQKTTLETPSFQFTANVMAAIQAEQQSVSVRYSPLIPKYMWVIIGAVVIGFTAYIWFLIQPVPLALPALNFDFMANNPVSKEVVAFTPSKITLYGILLMAIMLCVQIPILKQYLNTRQIS